MKFNQEVIFLSYHNGETTKGKKWHAIRIKDEKDNEFMLFGDKAKNYEKNDMGEKIKAEIEINSYFNHRTNKTENILSII